jgi:hypothetical protein
MILVLALVRKTIRWAIAGGMPARDHAGPPPSRRPPNRKRPRKHYPAGKAAETAPAAAAGAPKRGPGDARDARGPADGTELLKRGDSFAERRVSTAIEQYDRAIRPMPPPPGQYRRGLAYSKNDHRRAIAVSTRRSSSRRTTSLLNGRR